jgi:hypothetical protein
VITKSAKQSPEIEKPGKRKTRTWKEVLYDAESGIDAGAARAYARSVKPCGPKGVQSSEIYLRSGSADSSAEDHLLCMAFYPGQRPHYRPWIEIFCIREKAAGVSYFDSEVEDELLEFLCAALGPGGKIFVEYYSDRETCCGLAVGIPPAVTRQGYKLLKLGFTWFKDWYFAEGGHEGGQKLQAEKPLDRSARRRHMQRIKAEVEAFLERSRDWQWEGEADEYLLRAKERAQELLAIPGSPGRL